MSVLLGRIPEIDLPLLVRDQPGLSWLGWVDVTDYIRGFLQTASSEDVSIFIAECLGAIAHSAVKAEVSKVVAQYGSEGFLSLLNQEQTAVAASKVVTSKLALMFVVAHRVALRAGKAPSWVPVFTDDLTIPDRKVAGRKLGSILPRIITTLILSPSLALPVVNVPVVDSAVSRAGSVSGSAALASVQAATLSMAVVVMQAKEVRRTSPRRT